VAPYFTISRLLISTQHYFTSHLGDFNFDEPGDYIAVDYINKNGHLSPTGKGFTPAIIDNIRRHYHLKSRYLRLREKGLLTLKELSDKIKIPMKAIRELEKRKMIHSYKCTDKSKRLYEIPGNDFIKILHSLKGKRGFPEDFIDKFSKILKEVHYEG